MGKLVQLGKFLVMPLRGKMTIGVLKEVLANALGR